MWMIPWELKYIQAKGKSSIFSRNNMWMIPWELKYIEGSPIN